MSYWTDQRIREAVRNKIQALNYRKGTVARTVIADDALDFLEPLTLKTEDGRFVKVEPFSISVQGPSESPDPESAEWIDRFSEGLVCYRIVEAPDA